MRVMLLNQYYHPDLAPTSQLASDVGAELAAHGHEVVAVASARPYAGPGWRALTERDRGVRILRVPATALGRATRTGRAVDYASYLTAGLLPVLAGARPDVVVALSTPPLVALLGLALKRLRGSRLIYWVMDLYPDVALRLGALEEGSLPARALTALSRAVHDQADAIVALDDAMAARLTEAGVSPAKIEVIDNWVDDSIRPAPLADNPLRGELGLGARFTVSYSGNMGLGHDFTTLVAALTLLRTEDIHWLFIGDGPRRAELERAVGGVGLEHVTFLPYRDRDQLPVSLTAAHASIVSLEAGLAGLLAPSKLYGLLAAGVPVVYIGPPEGRTAEVVARYDVGVSLRNGDAAGLAAAVRALKRDPDRRAEMARRARRVFDERFTRARSLERHRRLIERVAGAQC